MKKKIVLNDNGSWSPIVFPVVSDNVCICLGIL